MTDHIHTPWVKRTDIKYCKECGEALGEEVYEFPKQEEPLRDLFAMTAMEGLIAAQDGENSYKPVNFKSIAKTSYEMADAMLKERMR